MRTCPRCGLLSPDESVYCECGFDLASDVRSELDRERIGWRASARLRQIRDLEANDTKSKGERRVESGNRQIGTRPIVVTLRRPDVALFWLAAAMFALGCASAGSRSTGGQRASTPPPPESESEASVIVRLETTLATDRFVFERGEVFLDHQPVPLHGEPPRDTVAAGAHELQVVLVYRSEPPGHRYRLLSRHAFTVADGETKEIVVRVLDDGNARSFDAFAVTFNGVPGT
jgi:hypothetical protein